MGAEIITTDLTSQYVIDGADFVVLMADATLTVAATTDPGFLADNTGNFTLTVHGQVVTKGKAAVLGHDPADLPLGALTVGETGLLQALTDVAVEIRRNVNAIDNAGTITGGAGGVRYAAEVTAGALANSGTIASLLGPGIQAAGGVGGPAPGLFEVVNTGRIQAATSGISIANESLTLANHGEIVALATAVLVSDDPGLANILSLVNTGLIRGDTAAVSATGHDDSITNAGSLVGDVLLGGGDNRFDNSGLAAGAVTMGAGADRVTNTGAVTGTLGLGDGANATDNSGRLETVTAGSGDDRFTNAPAGVVTGTLDLGDGANAVTNSGWLAALFTGSGDDDVTNGLTGVVAGSVTLGDGTNRLTNHGQIEAGLVFGAGDDTLLTTGTITGDLSLGAGSNVATITGALFGDLIGGDNADTIVHQGRITGAVSLGGGSDTLTCDGRIDGAVDLGSGTDVLWLGRNASLATGTLDGGSGDDSLTSFVDVEDVFNFEVIHLKGSTGLAVVADAIANTVYGNRAANDIDGGDGDDVLLGRLSGDTLQGGLGADTLKGGGGADELIGGAGADSMDGGRGRDTYTYLEVTDSTGAARDHILDFERGRDLIDLTELVAGEVTWLGKGKFTATGSAEARYAAKAGYVDLRIDVDGDGGSDMVIIVEDVAALAAGDFIL